MNPLFSSEYNFRDIYFLASAADDAPEALEGPQKAIQGWVDCFEKARLAGTAFAGGCTAPAQPRTIPPSHRPLPWAAISEPCASASP